MSLVKACVLASAHDNRDADANRCVAEEMTQWLRAVPRSGTRRLEVRQGSSEDLWQLACNEVVLPVTLLDHSGRLQRLLEQRRQPFVGSPALAYELSLQRRAAQRAWAAAGLPVAGWAVFRPASMRLNRFAEDMARRFSGGCWVGPSRKSVPPLYCRSATEIAAVVRCLVHADHIPIVERATPDATLFVGLLQSGRRIDVLPALEVPKAVLASMSAIDRGLVAGRAALSPRLEAMVQGFAARAFTAVGARDLAGLQMDVDRDRERIIRIALYLGPILLPGSLFGHCVAHAGLSLDAVAWDLIDQASRRGPNWWNWR